MLSVIVPSYNEEEALAHSAEVIKDVLDKEGIPFELIFVDDGSSDKTWDIICGKQKEDPRIKGLSFSRHFGKEAGITAGLKAAEGECCAVMDCDLQHPPAVLVEMYRLWEQGYEVIEGVKRTRGKENPLYAFAARTFYSLISKASGSDMSRASDFKLLDRKAVDAVLAIPEKKAFFRALSGWVGFKSTSVEFDVAEREGGGSRWSTFGLVKYAVSNIASFSYAPVFAVAAAGIFIGAVSCVSAISTAVKKLFGRTVKDGAGLFAWIGFIGAAILIGIGIIGFYIAQIYDEVRDRPRYIISGTAGIEDADK
ncbi:MAG: glycosyltransferase family 2 protein [Lachnospiraceae bacterium]|nr:glycosyltransferase family 2 protein [Lachnospiraceae bacterium]